MLFVSQLRPYYRKRERMPNTKHNPATKPAANPAKSGMAVTDHSAITGQIEAAAGKAKPFLYPFLHYHKGAHHDAIGEVVPADWAQIVTAVNTQDVHQIGLIPKAGARRYTNPLCGLADDIELKPEPDQLKMPPPPEQQPGTNYAETAGEAVELYWMALLRDVPFVQFATDATVTRAIKELNGLTDFKGPKIAGKVTPQTVFRGSFAGDLAGPFVSQYMLKTVRYGSIPFEQMQDTAKPGVDFLTNFSDWLAIQNGANPTASVVLDSQRRYIRSMRDITHYVHVDQLYEAYQLACLQLLDAKVPLNPGNPYDPSGGTPTPDLANQMGFGTFGGPHILALVCEVSTRALKAVWQQKWYHWLRLRPEEYGGLVDVQHRGLKNYTPYLHTDILNSDAVAEAQKRFGSSLLPLAFPEGSPTHPAYGAGHATVAGACITVLKAFFDASTKIQKPVEASADGLTLQDYTGPDAANLTVEGELHKLAANIGIGRNMAGVHWRSDYFQSLQLGERVAVNVLVNQRKEYREPGWFFSFNSLLGRPVRIDKTGAKYTDNGQTYDLIGP